MYLLCQTNNIETVEHFVFECSMYDTYRLDFVQKAQNCINNWDELTQSECLKQLFNEMPRALGKYV